MAIHTGGCNSPTDDEIPPPPVEKINDIDNIAAKIETDILRNFVET
jgi:hypothetical protein